MFIGALPTASNSADYNENFQLYDDEDNEGVTLADATVTLEIRRDKDCAPAVTATIDNGLIVVADEDFGIFNLAIPVATMRNLCAGTYECGITIEQNDETVQYFIGTFPVLDGVVS